MKNEPLNIEFVKQRLLSLDVMRGLIMILLAAESCMLYESLSNITADDSFAGNLVKQFFHHPWRGLRFWDLVQPAFMLMAGSALYISWHGKSKKGISWESNFNHILVRSFRLFLFGTALHCVYAGKLVWELWNVLTQLSVTTIIAWLIIRKSGTWQIVFSLFLLLLTELMYRFIQIPGFDQPFIEHHNFGAYMDTVLMGKINSDGWVAINFIPTAAHTIWGVVAGKLLISSRTNRQKVNYLIVYGIIALIAGYALDLSNVTPIIKRISTSSFVLVSGGWVLLIMAFLFWINDVKKQSKYAWIFTVVGMNAIFIYLFFNTVGMQWFNDFVAIFVKGFLGLTELSDQIMSVMSAIVALLAEWYLCYWLYQKKIFFKL
ncbi:acyltransferase family protein [Pseudopedobacter beijingensis]|uniref:Acyltransferase family protein n=1 Tax=Pseudopedobacter beijingensis TaxID=1207056 RepID=A0ABW4IBQ8_9SPHI